ncbi:unnamed protein product [Cuscuta campestris]|uniref:C2H2-type domain-containing protein n=1 Tax=Cuscuta campestris TaxID=132261 RepID=A0A484MHH0_9ASTE|nr:unnamed protein product [Cuscuta campestris]
MDFCWADRNVVVPEMIRKFRREMEDENTKLRKKARREYNETVRGLAEFVKKRDKRVIQMQAKRIEEMEKKKREGQARKKELEKLKAEKAKMYKEPDWTQVDNVEDEETLDKDADDKNEELYCIACGKKFKSEKQWKNHEQSKKHKEKIAVLREALSDEDKVLEELDVNERRKEEELKTPESEESGYFSATDDAVDELREQFEASFGFQGHSNGQESGPPTGKSGCTSDVPDSDDGDEASILEAMVSGHRSRQHMVFSHHSKMKNDDNDLNFMEYNYSQFSGRKRGTLNRRNRRAKAGMSVNNETDEVESSGQVAKHTVNDEHRDNDGSADNDVKPKCTVYDENVDTQDPSLQVSTKTKADGHEDDSLQKVEEIPRQAAIGKKADKKKDNNNNNNKPKNASKGRKEKATSKRSVSACEKCGEEFESRNKLHNHLGESGHSSLKSR